MKITLTAALISIWNHICVQLEFSLETVNTVDDRTFLFLCLTLGFSNSTKQCTIKNEQMGRHELLSGANGVIMKTIY